MDALTDACTSWSPVEPVAAFRAVAHVGPGGV